MNKENVIENEQQLTDAQVEYICEEMDKAIVGTPSEKIAKFPSNNGQEETDPESRENGENKLVKVSVDPNTGEHKILGSADLDEDGETFEEMCKRIENEDFVLDQAPVTEKDIIDQIAAGKSDTNSIISTIANETELSPSAIKTLLEIVNRKINREEFNIYRAMPDEIREMIDKYLNAGQIPTVTREGREFRNMICETLINEFITNITYERTMTDFNKELETIFEKQSVELAETIVGYTEERNRKYREYAQNITDLEKKKQMLAILDQIDEAYNLTNLKEFSKKCKIKKFDIEKYQKVFAGFLNKYKDSPYNIYDINMALPILERNLPSVDESITAKDIIAFFICFCKQTMNMKPDVVTDHAYMYYVVYNIVILDMNKGETKSVSDVYMNNIVEIIHNLRKRNNDFK